MLMQIVYGLIVLLGFIYGLAMLEAYNRNNLIGTWA